MTDLAKDRLKFWGLEVPPGRVHGPNSRSRRVYGCKCRSCVPSGQTRAPKGQGMSQNERSRKLRKAKRGKPVPPTVKHGSYAYRTYGCRCDICRQASHLGSNRKKLTWRDRARGRWIESKSIDGFPVDVICWPPQNAGADWTCPHPSHQEAA